MCRTAAAAAAPSTVTAFLKQTIQVSAASRSQPSPGQPKGQGLCTLPAGHEDYHQTVTRKFETWSVAKIHFDATANEGHPCTLPNNMNSAFLRASIFLTLKIGLKYSNHHHGCCCPALKR
mmetsp:Transcript_36800/g.63878  ORF Transcript_36800/g.63878 Transcript_36800/m.63878 type:complete len:120 (+) Transcript_36800:229-588(+)